MTALRTLAFGVVGLLSLALMTAQADDDVAKGQKGAKGKNSIAESFKMLDKNNDMKLSPEEFAAKFAGKGNGNKKGKGGEKLFKKLDTNNDGFLSADEFAKIGAGNQKKKKKD